jgi:hypothetical protein
MTKFSTIIFAVSMGFAGIVSVQPTPATAFTQIGEDMGKCTQNNFKDKRCACKDTACATKRSAAPANQGKPKPVVQIQGVRGVAQNPTAPNNSGNAGGGGAAPTPKIDKSSSNLMNNSATGKHLQK